VVGLHEDLVKVFTPENEGVDRLVTLSKIIAFVQKSFDNLSALLVLSREWVSVKNTSAEEWALYQFDILA
jgi:hypothetical protein